VNDPYLYRVYSILSVNGKVVDVCETRTGFRQTEFKGGAVLVVSGLTVVSMAYRLCTTFGERLGGLGEHILTGCTTLRSRCCARAMELYALDARSTQRVDVEACDRFGIVQVCLQATRKGW